MKPGSSKARIAEAATALISKRGFRETTIGDIEEAAGLTRRAGGFYRHFKSKEEVLVHAIDGMAEEMLATIRLEEIVSLKSPRAELLVIAQSMLRHAEAHRPLRLLLQREGHKLPLLSRAARRANARLAAIDVVPWVEDVLKRSNAKKGNATKHNARELALTIFGPIVLYVISIDRGDPAFGLKDEHFLAAWADHWANWLARGARD